VFIFSGTGATMEYVAVFSSLAHTAPSGRQIRSCRSRGRVPFQKAGGAGVALGADVGEMKAVGV